MKAYYRFQGLADFIISRAFILLIISIFLFPLMIQTGSAQSKTENLGPCNLNLLSSSWNSWSIAPDTTRATPTSRIPLQPINHQIYTLSVLGWWTCPPSVIFAKKKKKKKKKTRKQRSMWNHFHLEAGLDYFAKTYLQTISRTLLLLSLWLCSQQWLPSWVVWLPTAEWLFSGVWRACPILAQQPELLSIRWLFSTTRLITFWLLAARTVWLWAFSMATVAYFEFNNSSEILLVAGLIVSKQVKDPAQPAQISISEWKEKEKKGYKIHLSGEFYLTVDSSCSFYTRMIIIFLRKLESEQIVSRGRPTRDGRRPAVSQTSLAEAFGIAQPQISDWEKYWLDKNWPDLLSLKSSQVLTVELRQKIVEVFALYPWWGVERVYQYLHEQGIEVTKDQVKKAASSSGWQHLRKTLNRFFVVSEENIRPRDDALVKQLLNQVHVLLEKLKNSDQLTSQEELDIAYLQTAAASRSSVRTELGVVTKPKNVTFWGQKIKNVLLEDSTCEKASCCPDCGSNKVRAKGTKGYQKRYLDENGEWQSCEVFTKFCDNPDCKRKVFTDLPLDLLPHSPYSLGIRLQAFYLVAVVGGSYRRVAAALGVKSSRVYEWVSAFGQELLPMAALFGVVRSSGVVGIDEKYVQVPYKIKRGEGSTKNKNKKRRWMYVYLAVYVYTYDLLHIDIYAQNTQDSTHAFLLALKSKGYRPKVIVTDLRKEYGPAIEKVFGGARHHECIFHALQWWGRQMKDIYGSNYKKTHPEVVKLKEQVIKIFQTTSKRVAQKRYEAVMAQRESYVEQNPKAASIFDSLERHWPKLLNAIESTIVPKTNNAVELVIRRFDQHYTNFCGFDTIESARTYLGVFEKAYRFTPFTDDANEQIRGKCPLELAGYDISRLPMSQVCRGWALGWPPKQAQEAP